jgi:NCAIR mutase (PurE)-related protein
MFAWSRARVGRPQYSWSVLQAARSAANLGIERITVIEFGVAGGNGLLALERAAIAAESLLPVKIDVVGFDTATPQLISDFASGSL